MTQHIDAVDGLGKRITTVMDRSQSIKKQADPTEMILANQRLKQLKKVHKLFSISIIIINSFLFLFFKSYHINLYTNSKKKKKRILTKSITNSNTNKYN